MRDRRALAALGIGPSRFSIQDAVRESGLSVTRHIGRSIMTGLGTVLGSAAFVATLGLSSTLSQQVSSTFDVRRATEVRIMAGASTAAAQFVDWHAADWQDAESLHRLQRLNGVAAAGRRVELAEQPVGRTIDAPPRRFKVMGVDPGALAVIEPNLVAGRRYDAFHEEHAAPVVLLPTTIADALAIHRTGIAIFVDDRAFTVAGIFDDVARRPESMLAVLMPASTADRLVGPEQPPISRDVIVATAPGAAQTIAGQAALALRPQGPDTLTAIAPPDPRTMRLEIEASVSRSTLLLSLVALIVGAFSIANACTASIAARTPEIGLRRAIGARPAHIFVQLLGEATALGTAGGAVGVLIGLATFSVVCLLNRWTPVLDVRSAVLAVSASAGAGLLAGLWPAMSAMRVQPVAALQR
jgi:putative ABC transport system permease protein